MRMKELWMAEMEERQREEEQEEMQETMLEAFRSSIRTKDAQDRFLGRANSAGEWLVDWLKNTGQFEEIPQFSRPFIDWMAWANQLRQEGRVQFVAADGWIWAFRTSSSALVLKGKRELVAQTHAQGR